MRTNPWPDAHHPVQEQQRCEPSQHRRIFPHRCWGGMSVNSRTAPPKAGLHDTSTSTTGPDKAGSHDDASLPSAAVFADSMPSARTPQPARGFCPSARLSNRDEAFAQSTNPPSRRLDVGKTLLLHHIGSKLANRLFFGNGHDHDASEVLTVTICERPVVAQARAVALTACAADPAIRTGCGPRRPQACPRSRSDQVPTALVMNTL